MKRSIFCVGILPVLSGEDVPGHDEPGPRPRHLRHLRAGEGLQGTESRDCDILTKFMEAVLKCRLCMIGAANDPGAGHPHGGGENAAALQVQTIQANLWTIPC